MSQFVETLRVTDGAVSRLPLHQARMERTLSHFAPQLSVPRLDLLLAGRPLHGLFKARVLYSSEGGTPCVEYHPYVIRPLRSLHLVTDDTIGYAFKFADRSRLAALHAQRGDCDDVLIVRNGLITDTSYANVAFTDGTAWFTPRLPLLEGTMRRHLIDSGVLHECDLRPADVAQFKAASVFNAMIDLGQVVIPCSQIG